MPVFIIMSTIIKVDTLTPHLFFSKAVLTTRKYALHLRIRILANLFAYQNIQKLKTEYCTLVLVLVLIKDPFTIKRMLTLRHPFTRVSILCQCLQADTGKRSITR